jgi:hypothetical protein
MTDIVVKTGLIDYAAFERLRILPDVAAGSDDEDRSLLHTENVSLIAGDLSRNRE